MATDAISATLRPRSIAVVGASPRSFAGQIVQRNCADHRYGGLIVPINGKYPEIAGVPTIPSLSDLATAPGAVIALVGTTRVQSIAEEAAAVGAASVIVPGGGFTDSGGAASDLAASLATLSDVTGISIVGPNCMGVVDLVTGAMPYIGTVPRDVRRGRVAAIAQSGAVIEALVNCGGRVPFSTMVSSGAEAVTTTGDYLRFFATDPETDAVLVFIEGFVDAPDVLAAAREVAQAFASWRIEIEQALFEHYEPYAEAVTAGELPASEALPRIAAPGEVWSHVSLVFVSVTPLGGLLTTELGYATAWDDEHTLGARFQSEKFIELCGSVLLP